MMSDDSENDGIYIVRPHENNVYFKKYKLLLEECEIIQKSNERLVYRIQEVKKITRRRLAHVEYLKQRLKTRYKEDWSEIPDEVLDSVVTPPPVPNHKSKKTKKEVKEEKDMIPKLPAQPKQKKVNAQQQQQQQQQHPQQQQPLPEEKPQPPAKGKKPSKRKVPKAEKDPRAPKRPSNPFFQFCQEQRQPLMEQLIAELQPGQTEPNKQELTRQLALKWKTLNVLQKQVYVEMYERSKEKYAAEMTEYNLKK